MNRIKLITGIVILAHVVVVVGLSLSSALAPRKKMSKPFVVKHVAPKMAAPVVAAPAPVAAPSPPALVKEEAKPAPQPKKQRSAPKKEPVKKPAPAKKTAPPPPPKKVMKAKAPPPSESPKIPKKLLQDLEESIAKIEGKHISKTPSQKKVDVPLPIESEETSDVDLTFHEIIVSYLHEALNLPEHGEVKIELTLRQDGSVAKLIVLKSESEKNKSYLEKSLPSLKFPILDGMFSNKTQQTFILTFCNEL